MSIKVAMIGAGSIGFTRGLVRDILGVPELQDTEFALTDINEDNLDMVSQLVRRDIEANELPAKVRATTDRREALRDANYVFSLVRVGGLEAFQTDIDIPLKYGIDQCVGDTLCAGGLMYAQRTIPVLLEFCKDIREAAAPDCLFLNYSNPMAMNTWACNDHGGVRMLGLCHGVTNSAHDIATALGLKYRDLDYTAVGINHQTWFMSVKHDGRERLHELLEAFEKHPVLSGREKVRIDMMRRFGYYTTESNGHVSEYVPWYRKRPEEIAEWIDLSEWIHGETGGYLRYCLENRNWFEYDFPNWQKEEPSAIGPDHRGLEHASYIIEALETGRGYRGHFNVRNEGRIANLPPDCIVEMPGYIDANGISVPVWGALPLACAATCNASIQVQRMGVQAAVRGDLTLLKQAMLHDPLTATVCNPPEIWQLVDEMLVAQAHWLPQYAKEIPAARARLETEYRKPHNHSNGAARLKVKGIEEMVREKQHT